MVSMVPVLVTLGFGAISMLLQGCGGGGGGGSNKNRTYTPGMNGSDAMELFNEMYMGFDEKNASSPLGITMSLIAREDSFWKNIFCSQVDNPILGKTGCSLGRTDCRMSASLYNHKMLVSSKTGTINLGLSRHIGIVFNQTMTQNYYGKCSYIWDGASDRRMNGGCGLGATTDKCNSTAAAFYDLCAGANGTRHVCTVEDPEVKNALCVGYMGGKMPIPECHSCSAQCAFPGPALNYHRQADWAPVSDHLRDMAKARVKNQKGFDKDDKKTPKIEEWNEIVIDENLLNLQMQKDPALAIPAIVVVRNAPPAVKQNAYKVRDEYCKTMGLNEKIPVLAVDPTLSTNPFVFEGDEYIDVVAGEVVV